MSAGQKRKKPQLSAMSRRQLPNGYDFAPREGATCVLGPLALKYRDPSGVYQSQSCGKPAVVEIAQVHICADCYSIIEAIVADSGKPQTSGRRPECHPLAMSR